MSAMLKVVEKEGMENKNKALDAALAQIERAFGKGSIMKLGQREALEIEAISSACSPASGWEIRRFSISTPSFLA